MRSKRAFYNLITNLLLQLTVIAFGFVLPRVIIGKYGSEVNGLISSITNFLAYISLVEAGFGGVVQFLLYSPIAKKNIDKINDIMASSQKFFSRVSAIFIIYIILLCIFYPILVNSNFDWFFTASLIVIISLSTFAEYYFGLVYKVFLFADQKKYIVSIFSIITYVINIVVVLVLSQFNIPVQVLELVCALVFVIRPILQNIYVRKKYKIDIGAGNKNYPIEQKWDALAQHIAAVIHSNTDVVVLTLFSTLSEVSVYAVYALVTNGVRKIASLFYDAISSGFGDLIARNEKKKLKEIFSIAESLFFTFVTIIFACTFVMLLPFVEVYTAGISDTDYIKPIFGYLIVTAVLLSIIRHPYSSVSLAAGHYKETRNGAIVECVVNMVLSIILVINFGLVGVAIGTMVAMFIRTCEFIYHSEKTILHRGIKTPIVKIVIMVLELLFIVTISRYLPFVDNSDYLYWCINAVMVFLLSCAICLPINVLLFKDDFRRARKVFRNTIKVKGAKRK